jgi:hypothetical protein
MAAIFVFELISLHHTLIQLRIPGVLACIQVTIPTELSWFLKPTAGIQIKAGELACSYHHIHIIWFCIILLSIVRQLCFTDLCIYIDNFHILGCACNRI